MTGVNSLPSHGASVLGFGVRNLKYLSTTFHHLTFAAATTTTTIATTSSIPYSSPQPQLSHHQFTATTVIFISMLTVVN
jgi:hypothetical protein